MISFYLYYFPIPYIYSLSPTSIPSGSASNLTIKGENFPLISQAPVYCKVGSDYYVASVNNSGKLRCEIAALGDTEITIKTLSLSLNKIFEYGSLQLTVYPHNSSICDFNVQSISPSEISEYAQNRFIEVKICSGFINSASLSCYFFFNFRSSHSFTIQSQPFAV